MRATASDATASGATVVGVPVDEVTVLEDRARVARRTTLTLAKGLRRLRVDGVAPVLVDKTLRAKVDRGRVRDVRVDRHRLSPDEESATPLGRLDEEIEVAADALAALDRRLSRLDERARLVADALARALEEVSTDASWSLSEPGEWASRVDVLDAEERALTGQLSEVTAERLDADLALSRLRERRAVAAAPSVVVHAAIELDLEIDEDGPVAIEIDYLVPNACWRPAHRATLEGELVRVESEGCVWQNTGEDWVDVQLRLSTQRPSLGAAPPRLTTDRLAVQRKADVLLVEAREQEVERTGLGAGDTGVKRNELPGIDDGGDAMELRAAARATVPGDGRAHRVPLHAFEAPAERELFGAPELNDAILLRTRHENRGSRPLLAGPVELVRRGGLVGRTSVLYIAPGERFELGWGPDPALRLHREVETLDPEPNLLRTWVNTATRVVNKVSNLGPEEKQLEIVERVPVSELEKVQIEVDADETTDGAAPDEDGFVRFVVTLPGFARQRVTLHYVVRRHSDVVGL